MNTTPFDGELPQPIVEIGSGFLPVIEVGTWSLYVCPAKDWVLFHAYSSDKKHEYVRILEGSKTKQERDAFVADTLDYANVQLSKVSK